MIVDMQLVPSKLTVAQAALVTVDFAWHCLGGPFLLVVMLAAWN